MNSKYKERLVGSIILLCLAIIFIPPFYDGRNPFETDIDQLQDMPRAPVFPDSGTLSKQIADTGKGRLADIEKKVKADIPESARNDSQVSEESGEDTLKFDDFDAGEMTSKLLDDLAESSSLVSRFSKDKKLKQAWAVQVGSFQDSKRAQTVRDELIARDFQAFIKTVVKNEQTISRVFAGVSLDKGIAEEIKAEVAQKVKGLDSIVVPYQP